MEKEIKEIPFGAKDSELYKFEYSIPEGYEARIENGKVIVRKKDSEDERIRKEMIYFFTEEIPQCSIKEHADKMRVFISWLERQKENSFVYDENNYQDAKEKAWNNFLGKNPSLKEFKSIYNDGFSKGYQFGIHEEKPHKWTVHDEAVRKETIACLEKWKSIIPLSDLTDYNNILVWLKEELPIHNEEQKDQKPAEWSEEDELMRTVIIQTLERFGGRGTTGMQIDWLKSLHRQPKNEWSEKDVADIFEKVGLAKIAREQGNDKLTNALQDAMIELSKVETTEWSKEDEEYLAACIEVIDNFYTLSGELKTLTKINVFRKEYAEKLKSWLKSLHHQPHWKPSEEQMCELNWASASKLSPVLESLYNDLKKLK